MTILKVAIVIFLLLLLIFVLGGNENFVNPTIQTKPFVKLYEGFNQKDLIFVFQPLLNDPAALYLKYIFKGNVKSVDINIPLSNDNLDNTRKVQIWNIYDGDNMASSESDFYNTYTEGNISLRANPGKYKLLLDMCAGNRIKLNISEAVKKILIYVRF